MDHNDKTRLPGRVCQCVEPCADCHCSDCHRETQPAEERRQRIAAAITRYASRPRYRGRQAGGWRC